MKRVVITGLGTINPLGNDVSTYWENLVKGTSGIRPITRFDASKYKTQFAGEVVDFEPNDVLTHAEIKRSDLFTQYALYSADEAIRDSGLHFENMDPYDSGVIWGTGQGGMKTFEDEIKGLGKHDEALESAYKFNPFIIPKIIVNMASGLISMKYNLQGINYATVSACATSNSAIMDAFNYLRLGKAKVIITGGSEAPISETSIGGFNAMKALSTDNENYQSASKPFDANRSGFVMGEGAGALVLEEYEHAKARNAHIYAEVAGASMTADAYHMTSPHPEGRGAIKAMNLALKEAQISPSQVDYLNAHSTSTQVGDIIEAKAIAKVFKSNKIDVSSTKSMTGHLLGAAGAIEAIACIKSINKNTIPASTNIDELDPEIPTSVHIVSGSSISKSVKFAMSNGFGFGGHNSTVIFKSI